MTFKFYLQTLPSSFLVLSRPRFLSATYLNLVDIYATPTVLVVLFQSVFYSLYPFRRQRRPRCPRLSAAAETRHSTPKEAPPGAPTAEKITTQDSTPHTFHRETDLPTDITSGTTPNRATRASKTITFRPETRDSRTTQESPQGSKTSKLGSPTQDLSTIFATKTPLRTGMLRKG